MTVLIDTNVILDHALRREPFAEAARDCLERLIIGKAKIYLTASTITDIYYISRRTLGVHAAAKKLIAKLLNSFQIASVDRADCVNALDVDTRDYEDALVSVCARKVKAEWIITRNTKHYTVSPVPAVTPEEFLKKE